MRICRKNSASNPTQDCTPLYETFLDAAKKAGCAIELNTAGLRKDCQEIYPSRRLLELAFQNGVPITFGSDAHAPEEVGLNFTEAVALAPQRRLPGMLPVSQRQKHVVRSDSHAGNRLEPSLQKSFDLPHPGPGQPGSILAGDEPRLYQFR